MIVDSIEKLEGIYNEPVSPAAKKIHADYLIAPFQKLIEASPFFLLATAGPDGLDCSARGDPPGFVRVRDEKTLLIPDRRGNNKIDSLRNIIADPRVALLFLIPGTGTILRVNGRACISAEAQLCQSFAVNAALPKSVLIVTVEAAFFQCARALLRSRLWEMDARVAPDAIPSTGDVLSYFSGKAEEGKAFDEAATARMRGTLW